MEPREIAKHLRSLMQLDIDAVEVYDRALEHVTDDEVRKRFDEFRSEHDNHVTELAKAIRDLGGEPRTAHEDLAGEFAELVTAMRSGRGTEGALHAMRTAERYHNRHYAKAQEWDVDEALGTLLARFYDDEKRHLAYVEKKLSAPVGG